jgi:hypothetical protein
MANVYFTNFALPSTSHAFSAIWKLTRALKKAGWTYLASGDGTAKDTSGAAASDRWGGAADPASDVYPTALDGAAAWWNAQGPTTLKLSMASAPTAAFFRGETVAQASTNAEGELLGLDFDAASGQGHAVILPRTGTFDASHVISGVSTGTAFTPTALRTFVMEIVFWKSGANTTQGSIYLQRVSVEDEGASRFSALATQAGCTPSVAPGGGGTNNAFPTAGSYVGCGAQIANSITHANWFQVAGNLGRAQIVATNCAGASGLSPDGSFWVLMGDTSSTTQAQFFAYMRTDSGEDADLDPFVWTKHSATAYNSANVRVDASGGSPLSGSNLFTGVNPYNVAWRGWRRRGFPTSDTFVPLTTAGLAYLTQASTLPLLADNASTETVANAYSNKRVREQVLICSGDGTKKIRKGYPRWMWTIMGGTTFDTWDGRLKVCILPGSAGIPAVIVGPYDGTTTPLQA